MLFFFFPPFFSMFTMLSDLVAFGFALSLSFSLAARHSSIDSSPSAAAQSIPALLNDVGIAVGGDEGAIPTMKATLPPMPYSQGLVSEGSTCPMRPPTTERSLAPILLASDAASPWPPLRWGCVPKSNPAKNSKNSVTNLGTNFIGGINAASHLFFKLFFTLIIPFKLDLESSTTAPPCLTIDAVTSIVAISAANSRSMTGEVLPDCMTSASAMSLMRWAFFSFRILRRIRATPMYFLGLDLPSFFSSTSGVGFEVGTTAGGSFSLPSFSLEPGVDVAEGVGFSSVF
mmetsp:Transcript_23737/g.49676  ORF Transcript_23737/g.49676 Transcript_23737/m.49676 type:complete len:287 (-) Transcript_23737:679-1539(-)